MQDCPPISNETCGETGAIVQALSYLNAHYEVEGNCNSQVAIPATWLARFAAELTVQGACILIEQSLNQKVEIPADFDPVYKIKKHHNLAKHAEDLFDLIERSKVKKAKSRLPQFRVDIEETLKSIQKFDETGLKLRYPIAHHSSRHEPLEAEFDEHCDWALQFRRFIALITDELMLHQISETCQDAVRHLRASASCGLCLGDFNIVKPWVTKELFESRPDWNQDITNFRDLEPLPAPQYLEPHFPYEGFEYALAWVPYRDT